MTNIRRGVPVEGCDRARDGTVKSGRPLCLAMRMAGYKSWERPLRGEARMIPWPRGRCQAAGGYPGGQWPGRMRHSREWRRRSWNFRPPGADPPLLNGVSEFRENSLAARISFRVPRCAAPDLSALPGARYPANRLFRRLAAPGSCPVGGIQNLWHSPGHPGCAPAAAQPGFLCSRTQSGNPRPDTGNVCRAFRPGKIAIGYRLQTHSNGVLLSRSGTSPRVRRVRSRDPVT
jgi:hypothetical protein